MKKIILPLLLILAANINIVAQEMQTMYVAAKQGLNVMSKPNAKAKVLGKIAYGQKVTLAPYVAEIESPENNTIVVDGFTGYWQKVTFNNKLGYVIDSYLFPVAPPKKDIVTLEAYFNQLSTIAGKSYVKNPGDPNLLGSGGDELTKKLYKNGMEIHKFLGYEYGSDLYILPGFSIEKAFLLMRLLQAEPDLIGEKDSFPTESSTTKLMGGREKTLTVEKTTYYDRPFVTKLQFDTADGASIEFSIYTLDGQAVIFKSEGV